MRRLFSIVLPMFLLIGCMKGSVVNFAGVGEAEAGFLPGTMERLTARMQQADRAGDMPGGALAIHRNGRLVYLNSFGRISIGEDSPRATPWTAYDVASLAKPLAGWPCHAMLVRDTGLDGGERQLADALLAHTSGLEDEQFLGRILEYLNRTGASETLPSPAPLLDEARRVRTKSADVYRYANANHALLGIWATALIPDARRRIAEEYWTGAGFTSIWFEPASDAVVAPSGYARDGGYQAGRPFDLTADLMLQTTGIVPAHSGVFARAEDVSRFAQMLAGAPPPAACWDGFGGGGVLELANADDDGRRISVTADGLVAPTIPSFAPDGCEPGRIRMISGYTGCLMWADRDTGVSMALLTNASLTKSEKEWRRLAGDLARTMLQATKE